MFCATTKDLYEYYFSSLCHKCKKGIQNSKTKEIIYAAKPSYIPCQNDELVRLMLKGAEQFGTLKVTTGGPLNGGRREFLQLEIEGDQLSSIKGDPMIRYLTALNGNNGSSAISFGFGNQVMSCHNMWAKFMKESAYKIYHNKSMEEKLKQVPEIIFEALRQEFQMITKFHELAETSIHKELAHELVNSLIGIDKLMDKKEFG